MYLIVQYGNIYFPGRRQPTLLHILLLRFWLFLQVLSPFNHQDVSHLTQHLCISLRRFSTLLELITNNISHQASPSPPLLWDRSRYQIGKVLRGGEVIFNPKIYIADFGPFKGLFSDDFQKMQYYFPKRSFGFFSENSSDLVA